MYSAKRNAVLTIKCHQHQKQLPVILEYSKYLQLLPSKEQIVLVLSMTPTLQKFFLAISEKTWHESTLQKKKQSY